MSEGSSAKMSTQEDQFIIRFPPTLTKRMRKMLKNGQMSNIDLVVGGMSKTSLVFTGKGENMDPREGRLHVEEKGKREEYKVFLADLPCVVETHKTLNCKDFYKSGDIGQVLFCLFFD